MMHPKELEIAQAMMSREAVQFGGGESLGNMLEAFAQHEQDEIAGAFATAQGTICLGIIRRLAVDNPDWQPSRIPGEEQLPPDLRLAYRAGQRSVYWHILSAIEQATAGAGADPNKEWSHE